VNIKIGRLLPGARNIVWQGLRSNSNRSAATAQGWNLFGKHNSLIINTTILPNNIDAGAAANFAGVAGKLAGASKIPRTSTRD